jgi:prepilin-type N-terminal cleavage/methylation domain-containing protein
MRREEGFTLIEVLAAMAVLVIGILSTFMAVNASRKLTLVAERQTSMQHRAEQELERVKALPYNEVALTGTSSSWSTNASDYTYVNNPAGTCPGAPAGSAPTYQPDHSQGGSSATESLAINGCTYAINGSSTTLGGGVVAPATSWSDGRFSGSIYDFVTWTADPTCSQTSAPGSVCSTTNDYKRITIVVTLTGATQPSHPAILTALLPDPNENSSQNIDQSVGTKCTNSQGQTVSCSVTLSGTPHQFFPCDSSYSGSCGVPSSSGNPLHDTLESVLGVAPSPDQLGTTVPTGTNTNGSGTPNPPCYATDVGCGNPGGGLPLPPSGSQCGSPPANNTKSHAWVTPGIPSGTTWNLNGTGSFTTYIESGSGVAVNATVCVGLYLVPGGVLGLLTGNLLATPIGAAVSVTATAQAGVYTPMSFNFDVGSTDSIVGGGILGLPRVEVVVWIAASGSTDVNLAYDQAAFASQVTLMTS